MAEKDKKYYWLKLKRDFFKRHDIQIIEDMPNGKDYILFYLKLLCESVDHEGNLRFSEEIPYNEQMLATITRTNIDIVRSAIKVFESLKMIEVFDNGTYFMREVEKLIGTETYWAERKRIQNKNKLELENKALEIIQQQSNDIPTSPSKSKSKIKSIDIDKEKERKKENYDTIIDDNFQNDDVKNVLYEFIKMRKLIKKPLTDFALKKLCNKLKELSNNDDEQIKILEQSIMNNYQGIFPLKDKGSQQPTKSNWGLNEAIAKRDENMVVDKSFLNKEYDF